MEAKRGRTVITALFVLLLAATSVATTGCDLTKVGGADPSVYRAVSELPGLSSSYFYGLLSMDVEEDFGIGSPPE